MINRIRRFLKDHKHILSILLIIHSRGYFFFKCKMKGNDNKIYMGEFSTFKDCKIYIEGNHNYVSIGKRCRFLGARLWLDQDNNSVEIGNETTIRGSSLIGAIEGTKISIGNDCMFSELIDIRTGDSHSIIDSNNQRINKSQNIKFGNHVWIAKNVTLLKGV